MRPYKVSIKVSKENKVKVEYGPMPNVVVALSILCSTPQSLADDHY